MLASVSSVVVRDKAALTGAFCTDILRSEIAVHLQLGEVLQCLEELNRAKATSSRGGLTFCHLSRAPLVTDDLRILRGGD